MRLIKNLNDEDRIEKRIEEAQKEDERVLNLLLSAHPDLDKERTKFDLLFLRGKRKEAVENYVQNKTDPRRSAVFKAFNKKILTEVVPFIEVAEKPDAYLPLFDWKNHNGIGFSDEISKELRTRFIQSAALAMRMPNDASLEEIEKAEKILEGDRSVWVKLSTSTLRVCYSCEEVMQFQCNGERFSAVHECAGPLEKYEIEVDFPTGELYVKDDLRNYFYEAEMEVDGSGADINYFRGTKKTSEIYSKANYLTGFVGNSCPGVYQNIKDPSKVLIASVGYNPETDKEEELPGYEFKFSICTDLWWFSIAEKPLVDQTPPIYKERIDDVFGYYADDDAKGQPPRNSNILKVPPGRYRAVCYNKALGEAGTFIYAEIEKID